jgi:hypothetical protein
MIPRDLRDEGGLTDAEIRAQGRHRSAKVLPRYAKRTMKQGKSGAPLARRAMRHENKTALFVRRSNSRLSDIVAGGSQPIEMIGAGEGNRTLVISWEGCCDLNDFRGHSRQSVSKIPIGHKSEIPASGTSKTAAY